MELTMEKDGTAILNMSDGGDGLDMECTYQAGEATIALSCFGSSGITLTKLKGGDLEANMDGTIVRFEKL